MEEKPADTEVFFVDAVHPEHNAQPAYGWMKRGERRVLKTNSGRQMAHCRDKIMFPVS